jgi:hypothetical protein
MVYGCGCVVVGKLQSLNDLAKMRFFWLPLSMMNCNGEPFTHICEWKRCSPSSGSSGSSFWILVVANGGSGFCINDILSLVIPLVRVLAQNSEHASISEAFSSATSACLADIHLCCEWSSYGTHTTFHVLLCLPMVLFFACGFEGLSWVTPPWLCPLFCGLGVPFPALGFADPKSASSV